MTAEVLRSHRQYTPGVDSSQSAQRPAGAREAWAVCDKAQGGWLGCGNQLDVLLRGGHLAAVPSPSSGTFCGSQHGILLAAGQLACMPPQSTYASLSCHLCSAPFAHHKQFVRRAFHDWFLCSLLGGCGNSSAKSCQRSRSPAAASMGSRADSQALPAKEASLFRQVVKFYETKQYKKALKVRRMQTDQAE